MEWLAKRSWVCEMGMTPLILGTTAAIDNEKGHRLAVASDRNG